jgi:hypothetical protein
MSRDHLAFLEAAKSPLLQTAWLPSLPRILDLSLLSLIIPNSDAPHIAPAYPSSWLCVDLFDTSSVGAFAQCAPSQQASSTGSKRSGGHPAHHHRPPFHRITDIVIPLRQPIPHRIARRLPVVKIVAHIDPLAPLSSAPAPTPNPRGDDVPCHYNHIDTAPRCAQESRILLPPRVYRLSTARRAPDAAGCTRPASRCRTLTWQRRWPP